MPVLDAQERPVRLRSDTGNPPTVAGLLNQHGENVTRPHLPETFRRLFQWHLKDRPVADTLAWLQLWRALGSAQGGTALMLAARLCALAPDAHAWANPALTLPPQCQLDYLACVLELRAYRLPASALSAHQLITLADQAPDAPQFGACLRAVLANLQRDVSASYTLQGCALLNRKAEPDTARIARDLSASKACASVPMAALDRMAQALGPRHAHWVLSAWRYCGILPCKMPATATGSAYKRPARATTIPI